MALYTVVHSCNYSSITHRLSVSLKSLILFLFQGNNESESDKRAAEGS